MTTTVSDSEQAERSAEAARHAEARRLADKMWSYCDVLRDAGVSAIDYVEQLTYLLFLKMADERAKLPESLGGGRILPEGINWETLKKLTGAALEEAYREALAELGKEKGILGTVFRKAQNRVQEPALLRKLIVDLMDNETWGRQGTDVKGDAYEQLLARSATDVKSGAGQYFTPRPLINAIVDCARPAPGDTIIDPACGTGGFLLAANDYIRRHHTDLTPGQRHRLAHGEAFLGTELVDGTARLAAMNMLLHGMCQADGESPIQAEDALATSPTVRASLVLANPPFGKKSAITVIGLDGKATRDDVAYDRQDFWQTTTNKQLNFVQHIARLMAIPGRAAVVLPDNVLFEGGAGEGIRRALLKEYDVHTLLRLPTGIFYAGGVKANVLFFDRKPASEEPWTRNLWVYDFRTGQHFTLKQNPLRREHLQDFVDSYLPGRSPDERVETERFRKFTYDELVTRDKCNLDIFWLKDPSLEDADALQPPEVIAQEIIDDLEAALSEFAAIAEALQNRATPQDPGSPSYEDAR
ncbi:type I restriction enzyme M protein [Streptosporangium canum]|uniref:site-specific DNA-methyltransferase (adenine-specific) n=1 Tax=Streptosporangium canum TaxID=324952 RepID=A0A1I4BJA7_9ACTN|nr:class I SAM-dependent DNA methyltransferase [Streptosporangium canum]SFK68450.1 type I restriction enzyme M protein [Streptosporangium canum]